MAGVPALMLYAFDIDGTLIRGFLGGKVCDECKGEGRIQTKAEELIAAGRAAAHWNRCEACKGKGQFFGEHTPYDIVDVLPRRLDKLRELWETAYPASQERVTFALCTNQGGVAMGYQQPDAVRDKMARVLGAVEFFGGRPTSLHVAIGHPHAKVEGLRDPELVARRKPAPGMLEDAMLWHGATRSDTLFVGDMPVDRDCAEAAGVRFMWAHEFFGGERGAGT